MYLIVIEYMGAAAHHAQPYRTASTTDEAIELMRDYSRIAPHADWPCPEFFLVYRDQCGTFMKVDPAIYDADLQTGNAVNQAYQNFLRATGRI